MYLMDTKAYTTTEVAAKVGVSRQTLYTWIESGRIDAPKPIRLGNRSMRLWTKADIERVGKFKGTLPMGRPRKKKK